MSTKFPITRFVASLFVVAFSALHLVLHDRPSYPGSSQASQKRSVEMVEGLFILWQNEIHLIRRETGKSIVQDDCDSFYGG